MATTRKRLYHTEEQIGQAVAALEADPGTSPMMLALVKELRSKSKKAICALNCVDDSLFEQVIEMEQAAESARYAADADKGLTGKTRKVMLDAYMSVTGVRGCRD